VPFNLSVGPGERKAYKAITGVVVGIVTNNVDDQGLYRVKVRLPTLPNGDESGSEESAWARIATFGAGPDRGAFFLPEVNDEVLVAFEHGDIGRPIVIGTLWSNTDKAIYNNKENSGKVKWAGEKFHGKLEAKKNDVRAFTSRKFHQIVFNDNASDPLVALHSSQKHRIVLDDKGGEPTKIEIYDGKEENYVLIDTKNKKITVETKTGDILLKAKENIKLEAKNIEVKSDENTKFEAGKNFNVNASSNVEIKASGTGKVESSGAMTIKGQTVNIN
jgi:uncharacterized protein involved in type VI secretion and phage assembly